MPESVVVSNVPARLDSLPWSAWHWRILVALGTVWILDGLEVTVVGALGNRLTRADSGISLSAVQVGTAASAYVTGAVVGALIFGYLSDRFGRKRMFLVTLAIYVAASVGTAFAFNPVSFFICRCLTGTAIGGEYSAINSAIDELIPARVRGAVDLAVNGSYWLGAILGALVSVLLLNQSWLAPHVGWRLAFGLGALLAVVMLFLRRHLPESPRWLLLHGRHGEAERLVSEIEASIGKRQLAEPGETIQLIANSAHGLSATARTLIRTYPKRTVLGLSLFAGQAFLYNSVFFTQSLVLGRFFRVEEARVGLYIIPLAIGNFVGPLVLGGLFDRLGRRSMIAATFGTSGALLIFTGILLTSHRLSGTTLTVAWSVVFFFASAAASSAYLTVSEIFPMEIRALAIALFYAVGTGLGGIVGPWLFAQAVQSGTLQGIANGYYLGALLMIVAAVVELFLGVDAARQSLERVAAPLSLAKDVSPGSALGLQPPGSKRSR